MIDLPNFLGPQWMLIYGIFISLFLNHQEELQSKAKLTSKKLLELSIILLGSKLLISDILTLGIKGMAITFLSLGLIFIFSSLLYHFYFKKKKMEHKLMQLISAGTAICGGSAIAAIAPVIKATGPQVGLSMGIVFILNAAAIFIFPPLGKWLEMSANEFGVFCALAIHDTSSVVAASSLHSEEALKIATTYKLTRALWIIPLSLLMSFVSASSEDDSTSGLRGKFKKIKIPYFIFGFIFMSLLFSFVPDIRFLIPYFVGLSKWGLSLTLFLIGFAMDLKALQNSALQILSFGILLWIFTLLSSYFIVASFS